MAMAAMYGNVHHADPHGAGAGRLAVVTPLARRGDRRGRQRAADAVEARHQFAASSPSSSICSASTSSSRPSSATTATSSRTRSARVLERVDLADPVRRPRADRRRRDARGGGGGARAAAGRGRGDHGAARASASRPAASRCRCRRSTGGRRWCRPARVVIENANGSAPGLWLDHGDRSRAAAAGAAARAEADAGRAGRRSARASATSGEPLVRRVIRITGRIESHIEEALQPLYREWAAAVAADRGDDSGGARADRAAPVRARGIARPRRRGARRGRARRSSRRIGADVYSTDGRTLEAGRRRSARRARTAHRGGRVVHRRLHHVAAHRRAGSSRYVEQSVITYSNEAKTELLGVPPDADRGARRGQRAGGARDGRRHPGARARRRRRRRHRHRRAERRHAGEAGRHGRRCRGHGSRATRAATFRFIGEREQVKFQASQAALDMVRRMLAEWHVRRRRDRDASVRRRRDESLGRGRGARGHRRAARSRGASGAAARITWVDARATACDGSLHRRGRRRRTVEAIRTALGVDARRAGRSI